MNHTAVASPTEMARFFMLAPHVNPAAGSNKQGFGELFLGRCQQETAERCLTAASALGLQL